MFRRSISPPYSGSKNKPSKETGMKQEASRSYSSTLKMEVTYLCGASVDKCLNVQGDYVEK
jgi:hypothetical protein